MVRSIVIGAGRIALSHLPHIISNPKVNLVAIIEPSRVARFLFRRLTNIKTVSSIDKISDDLYDTAFVLTPPTSHFSISKKLLKKGKNVFVEKPLTLNPKESENLLVLAKKNRVQFSVGYVYRHHPIFIKLKKILTEINIKKVRSVHIQMLGNVVTKEMPKTWRNTGVGSGCIYDYGCHVIDLTLFLFGRPNDSRCTKKIEIFQKGVVDAFDAEIFYADNFKVNISCNWADEFVRKAGIEIRIITEEELIRTDGQVIEISGRNKTIYNIKDLDTDIDFYLRGEEFQNQLSSFVDNIINNQSCYKDTEDACLCDSIISKLYGQTL